MTAPVIQVIDRAFEIIEQLSTSEVGLSITELSRRTNLPKSTVFRILNSLTERHYVLKNEQSNLYQLGYKFVEISSIYLNKIELKTEAVPIMRQLATTFSAICYLGVLEKKEVVYLEKIETMNSLRLYSQIGKREPLHCTGLGKVLLSKLTPAEFDRLGKSLDLVKFTPKTITNFEELQREVTLVRNQGYAVDNGEQVENNYCLAVPIYDYTRKAIAAMSISKIDLFKSYKIDVILPKMLEASEKLSRKMGYSK